MRLQKQKGKAKKVTETFRIPVVKRLTPIERRDVEEQIKTYIKDNYGKV